MMLFLYIVFYIFDQPALLVLRGRIWVILSNALSVSFMGLVSAACVFSWCSCSHSAAISGATLSRDITRGEPRRLIALSRDIARATMVLGSTSNSGLCQLAKRVPRVKKTGDTAKDCDNENNRQALIGIIQHLHLNPSVCMPTFLALTSGKIKETDGKASEQWPECYNHLARIPKYAKAQVLELCSAGAIDRDLWNKIDRRYPDMIHSLFECATQCTESTYLPRNMLDKDISMQVFILRIRELGNLPGEWLKNGGILHNGEVKQWLCSPYTLHFSKDGPAEEIRYHDGAKSSIDNSISVTTKYEVLDPLHVNNTTLKCGAVSVKLQELFGRGEGPNKHTFDPKDKNRNPFKILADHLQTLPPADCPKVTPYDAKYLELSEKEAADQRKQQAKARLQARAPAAKRARHQVTSRNVVST